ncbi:type II RES/Xre toxin-antitoxin system antitoxin [Dyadobacter bucti]|uniref:type II RES/Xre toxin-antitoxin system antitoxin n=1 Tax=Dyadobacter bucti TaxID=2572203 RepID=UPI001107FEC5|nr:antitoxin Xre/MbcA/ParS toxin-binding domain-containing protein [Dyadobacter bucti]
MHTQILDILGGPKAFKQNVDSFLSFIEITETGFPIAVAQLVQKRLNLSNKQFSNMLSLSESTFQRRIKNKSSLSTGESEKVVDLSKIIAKGQDVFENDDDFKTWLNSPVLALGNKKPLDLLGSSIGREEILNVLFRIEHGIFS